MIDQYIVRGTINEDPNSEPVFYSRDCQSGYAQTSMDGPITSSVLKIAVDWFDSCGPDAYVKMHNPQVMKVDYTPVDISEYLEPEMSWEEWATTLDEETKTEILRALA